MAISAFDNKGVVPSGDMVAAVLGDSFKLWESVMQYLTANYKKINEPWYFSKTGGWSKNIKSDKRSLFYFTPTQGSFQAFFFLSEKAVAVVRNSDLPKKIIDLIPETKQCVCGFSFVFDIRTEADANALIKLIAIKDNN